MLRSSFRFVMFVVLVSGMAAWIPGCTDPKDESARGRPTGVQTMGRTEPDDGALEPVVAKPRTEPLGVAMKLDLAQMPPEPAQPKVDAFEPEPEPGPVAPVDEARAAELAQLAESGRLGYDLYRRLATKPGNLVISPASLGVALAMALGGARGETATELARALGVSEKTPESAHRRFGTALRVWNASASVKLAVAARVFVEKSAPIEEGFLALTRDRYRAPSLAVSFDGDAEAARGTINRWFEARTDRRVRELLPAGALDRLTRLVLASAVAFKGTWKTRFDPAHTSPGIFTTAAGEAFEVPMMQMKAKLSWAKLADGTRVLELPYAGDEVRMILLLPATTAGLPTLEAALGVPALAQWRAALKHVNVVVALPRFKLEPTALRLKEELAALGVRRAFEKTADFTAIARLPEGLFLSDVYHCATLEVNEEGAEAAAGTAVVMATMSADFRPGPAPPDFIADRPFLFVLFDTRTGLPLFLGRVAQPASPGAQPISMPRTPPKTAPRFDPRKAEF